MSDPDELLPGIRQKILDGTLPKQNCRMTWYGPGTGGMRAGHRGPRCGGRVRPPEWGYDPSPSTALRHLVG